MYAFVTLVMNVNPDAPPDRYVPGALVLAHRLRTGTRHDLVAMHDGTLAPESLRALRSLYDHVVKVPLLTGPLFSPSATARQRTLYRGWIAHSYTKWACLSLTQYERVCFVDADTLPLDGEDFDVIIDTPAPAAVFKHRATEHAFDAFLNRRGAPVPPALILRATTTRALLLDASLVVLPTARGRFQRFERFLANDFPSILPTLRCYSGVDEIAITLFMLAEDETWHSLPLADNALAWDEPVPGVRGRVRMLDFFGEHKPWELAPDAWPDLAPYADAIRALVDARPDLAPFFPLHA